MKRFLGFAAVVLLGFALVSHAEAPDELFVQYYNMIQEADAMAAKGQEQPALDRYREAEVGLKKLELGYPNWNSNVVSYRLRYVAGKIAPLAAKYPNAPVMPTKPKTEKVEALPAKNPEEQRAMQNELERTQQQVIDLRTEKNLLELKLKEALAARPAAVDPGEMSKAQDKVTSLQKEIDLLKANLDQEQKKSAKLVEPTMMEQYKKQLEEATSQLAKQSKTVATLTKENEALQKKAENSSKSREVADLKKQNEAAQKEIEKAHADEKAAEARMAKLTTSASRAEELEQQLKQSQSSLKEQTAAIESLRKENKKLEALLTDPNAKLDTSTVKMVQMEKDLEAARQAKAATEATESTLHKQIASLEAEKRALETQLNSSPKIDTKAAAKVKDLEQQKRDLEKKLKEVTSSAEKDQSASAGKAEKLERDLQIAQSGLKEQQVVIDSLRAENKKMEKVLTDPNVKTGPSPAKLAALETENKNLQGQLKAALAADPNKTAEQAAKLKELEQQKDDLEKQLKAASKELADRKAQREAAKVAKMADDLAALRARIEVLDAHKVPYTKEELALFKAPEAPKPVAEPAKPVVAQQNSQELPAAARPLILEAQRAFNAQRLDEAEAKYQEVLKMSNNNVFTLANLGAIQLQENHLKEAEANLSKAVELDPKDAFSLSLYGILKFRQDKYDDALDALSRSAQLDPNNAETQNYLGITLSQKGQRGAAEAALRKAIQLAPGNASAHQNLAVIYATQKPPLLELARWHYKKALEGGHPKNEELEKLLEQK